MRCGGSRACGGEGRRRRWLWVAAPEFQRSAPPGSRQHAPRRRECAAVCMFPEEEIVSTVPRQLGWSYPGGPLPSMDRTRGNTGAAPHRLGALDPGGRGAPLLHHLQEPLGEDPRPAFARALVRGVEATTRDASPRRDPSHHLLDDRGGPAETAPSRRGDDDEHAGSPPQTIPGEGRGDSPVCPTSVRDPCGAARRGRCRPACSSSRARRRSRPPGRS